MSDVTTVADPYEMKFDVGTIKHLGLQMYSTLPPVIGELVANAWDANASKVEITIPDTPIDEQTSEIIVKDDGDGMSDEDVRQKYLIIGRDRREQERSDKTQLGRKIMGRKGIGKFSAFGIAKEIVIESKQGNIVIHFAMNYDELMRKGDDRVIEFPSLEPTGDVDKGTKITLRHITKFKTRSIPITRIRRGLARRFAIIEAQEFEVVINGEPISPAHRDLQQLLDIDMDDNSYLWEYDDEEIKPDTGWTVSGWIGALDRTSAKDDGIDRGIVLMARGKMVQEPFVFNAVVGQQYALSYLIGELNVEFVDDIEDTIATTRNSLVWDTEPNTALMEWGQKEVNKCARDWGKRRSADNKRKLQEHELYREFQQRAQEIDNQQALKIADDFLRDFILKNPDAHEEQLQRLIKMCLDFLEVEAFWEIIDNIRAAQIENVDTLIELFREWEIVEAKEMARVTEGRIETIEKLQRLIEANALEVPTMHNFLKEFPWVIDPRWTLVDNEVQYSELLHSYFPENDEELEENKRIDFLCVGEGKTLVIVEIKRPKLRASLKDLEQIKQYVRFARTQIRKSSDPAACKYEHVVGYLLCGTLVNTDDVQEEMNMLADSEIYVRLYRDLLSMVRQSHADFLARYNQLRQAKQNAANRSDS